MTKDVEKTIVGIDRPAQVNTGVNVSNSAEAAKSARGGIESNRGYVRVSRGYPVQPGQTWHDLTAAQRNEWMRNHENRWKAKFMQQEGGASMGGSMNWTRG